MLRTYLQLPRTVYVLSLGTLINRAGTLLIPFLTLYLVEHLHTTMRFATWGMATYGLGCMGAVLVGGHFADAVGRRVTMVVATFGSATLMFTLSFLTNKWSMVACVGVLGFVGEMFRPACSAMIADVTPPELRKAAYSLQYVAINLGFSIAPVVGGFIVERSSYHWLFWIDAATTTCLGVIIVVGIRESLHLAHAEHAASAHAQSSSSAGLRHVVTDGTFVVFCLATLAISMMYMQAVSTLPLYFKDLGIGKEQYGQIIAVNGAMIALLQLPFAAWLMRFDRSRLMPLSSLVTGVGFGLIAFAHTPLAFVGTVVVWTAGEMMAAVLVQPIVSDLAPPRLRARYMGVLSMCFAGGSVVGIPLGGEVLARHGGQALWLGCLGASATAALLYFSIRRRIREHPPTATTAAAPAEEATVANM
ncbi:MAG TPA: MFS transporter [Phycisphaerae bacterium]|nr:MFS transporter [Phycisphaerae bacterium]